MRRGVRSRVNQGTERACSVALDGFIEFESRGYLIALFPCRQNTGEPTVAGTLDMSALYSDKLKQENSPAFVSRWVNAFETAASYFQITPTPETWNPHPNACPTTPCPPCSE